MSSNLFNRYQNKKWYIKWYRWLRYRPISMLKASFIIIAWWWNGAKIPETEKLWFDTKWKFIKFIWIWHHSIADIKMGHYYTLDEVITELKNELATIS